jgi:hypothetical protein
MTKAVAKALYVELRKNHRTAQIIVVPGFAETSTTPSSPARLLTRQISHLNPRRSWRFYTSPMPTNLYEADDVAIGVAQVAPFINDIEHYFRGFADSGWETYKTPIAIELTYDDIREVSESTTPQAFIRRLNRARIGAGFDEALFESPEPASAV